MRVFYLKNTGKTHRTFGVILEELLVRTFSKDIVMTDRVIIFDTTLRDGEQALKASLTVKEKLQIALALERLGDRKSVV